MEQGYTLEEAMEVAAIDIENFIERIKNLSLSLEEKHIEKLYLKLFMTIYMEDINNIPCFSAIKDRKIEGMDFEMALRLHKAKFKRLYGKIEKYVKNDENKRLESLEEKIAEEKIDSHCRELINLLESLTSKTIYFQLKETVELHKVIINTIVTSYIKELNLSHIKQQEILAQSEEYFIKLMGRHYGKLQCGKYK